MKKFPFTRQFDTMDCGPACLAMVSQYYGKTYTLQRLRELSFITRQGVSLLGISDAAEAIGMRTTGVRISFEQLTKEARLPLIAHWKQQHFVVVHRIHKGHVFVADPGHGLIKYRVNEFLQGWQSTKRDALLMSGIFDREPYEAARRAFEREYVRRLASRCDGDVSVMAERAGMPEEVIRASMSDGKADFE